MAAQKLVEEFTWEDVRLNVKKLDPEFAKTVDQIRPDPTHRILKVKYPYGYDILKQRKIQIPHHNRKSIALAESNLAEKLKKDFDYNHALPIGMVLKNAAELYLDFKGRIMSYRRFDPGKIIGLTSLFDKGYSYDYPSLLWSISSGARSTFMLPKISDENRHNQVRNFYKFSLSKPTTLYHHWDIFKAIANSIQAESPWYTEILFFSKKWFAHQDEAAWIPFNDYLLQLAWKRTAYRRNQYFLNTIASILQEKKEIKFTLATLESVMHLVAIGLGETPGFRAAINDHFLPKSVIEKAYLETYGINYAPIIMEPSNFYLSNPHEPPVYYSLNYPSSLYFSLKGNKKYSIVHDLYEIGRVLKKYTQELMSQDLGLQGSYLEYFAQNCNFTLYHTNTEGYPSIQNTQWLESEDANFAALKLDQFEFPKSSLFFNGCIRIAKNEGVNYTSATKVLNRGCNNTNTRSTPTIIKAIIPKALEKSAMDSILVPSTAVTRAIHAPK